MLCLAALVATALAALSTSLLARNTFITIPLAVPTLDGFYNAHITDSNAHVAGGRIDLVQPDLWLIDGAAVPDCSVLELYLESVDSALWSSLFLADGLTYPANECYVDGAYIPVATTTAVSGLSTLVTTTAATSTGTSAYDVPYPNGVSAVGFLTQANFTWDTTDNEALALDDFAFVLVTQTNKYSGGFGLASHPQGLGLLDYFYDKGLIVGKGYSIVFDNYADLNDTAGALLLGAVDTQYVSGSFYAFPSIPYVDWNENQLDRVLPIIALDSIVLENQDTAQQVTLLDGYAVPVLLDSRLSFSYLPLTILINLAVQANAYYNLDSERWIVKCSDISGSNAVLKFAIGPLTISIPLEDLMVDAFYGDNYLYFSGGSRACFLNVLPSSSLGYSSLGLPFLSHIYMAMDNEAGNIAMGVFNSNVLILLSDYDFSSSASSFNTAYNASAYEQGTSTKGYILSGHIPFATTVNATLSYTLTFFSANATVADAIPSRLSDVTISLGEVYTGSAGSKSASAASARTSSGGAAVQSYTKTDRTYVLYLVLLAGSVMGLALA